MARGVSDSAPIETCDAWANEHEHTMARALFAAGTTRPGVDLREDQAALSVLCARPEVDPGRVGCGGLSAGGLRTAFLGGLDDRIRACFCAGFLTTWRDLTLYTGYTHTWMAFAPLRAGKLDFPEILALRAPLPALVQHSVDDPLFVTDEVRKGADAIAQTYALAGAPDAFQYREYPGVHKFDRPMQADAFAFIDAPLRARA